MRAQDEEGNLGGLPTGGILSAVAKSPAPAGAGVYVEHHQTLPEYQCQQLHEQKRTQNW